MELCFPKAPSRCPAQASGRLRRGTGRRSGRQRPEDMSWAPVRGHELGTRAGTCWSVNGRTGRRACPWCPWPWGAPGGLHEGRGPGGLGRAPPAAVGTWNPTREAEVCGLAMVMSQNPSIKWQKKKKKERKKRKRKKMVVVSHVRNNRGGEATGFRVPCLSGTAWVGRSRTPRQEWGHRDRRLEPCSGSDLSVCNRTHRSCLAGVCVPETTLEGVTSLFLRGVPGSHSGILTALLSKVQYIFHHSFLEAILATGLRCAFFFLN